MSGELQGKVAIINGGSGGIGRVITAKLASEGCDCLIAGLDDPALAEVADAVARESGRRVVTWGGDLRTLAGCAAVHKKAAAEFDGIDILVNTAGATRAGDFLEQTDDVWEDGFALKFYSSVRLCRLFWTALKASRGSIVNIVGGMARTPAPDFLVGGAVNAALGNFSKGLAGLGLRDDVNVNAIYPGMTVTARLREIFQTRAEMAGTTVEEIERSSVEAEGIRRLGRPEDVAELVAYLCSPKARHIHGVAIAVDGGATPCLF